MGGSNSNFHFMRCGPQPIELLLGICMSIIVSTDHSFISFIVNLTYEFYRNYINQ
jgi:hypothetical protein